MSDKREKAERERVALSLPRVYVDALNRLVESGLYVSHGEIIKEALRPLFRRYEFEPFWKSEGSPEEGREEADLHE